MRHVLQLCRPRVLRRTGFAALAALILAALVPIGLGAASPQPLPTQRVDLRVLVVGVDGNEAGYKAWQAALQREGVPYDLKLADSINDGVLADYPVNRARYQAVIVTTGVDLPAPAATALAKFESTFRIRRISEIGDFPSSSTSHGLNPAAGIGNQDPNVGQLTALGMQLFPYLKGPVPIEGPGAFGFQATPAPQVSPGSFQRVLNGPSSAAYLGIYTSPLDLREEMVMTVQSNQFMLHNQLLRHGMLNWVTRGVYLGTQRNYFTLNIDDIFLPNTKWDPVSHTTPGDATPPTCGGAPPQPACVDVRMIPSDVRAAINWQNANGFKFDFMFNGVGTAEARRDSPVEEDPLFDDPTDGLLVNRALFRWVNHTYTHFQMDAATPSQIQSEILNNKNFATQNGISINPQELVTGEHSGLGSYTALPIPGALLNNFMAPALLSQGVTWIGDDNSVQPNQRPISPSQPVALTVPRYPSNVYYNVATRSDQLNEYNWIYALPSADPPGTGNCVNTTVTTCRSSAAQWLTNSPNGELSYVNSEVGIMFGHLMGNDPRPHYAHQSNLILGTDDSGILYKSTTAGVEPGVLDVLLAKYNTYFNVPLAQPTFSESGQLLQREALWAGHVAAGRASGYLLDGKVHVVTTQGMSVPLTGVNPGDLYGGQRSGWASVETGDSVFTPADPINVTPPTMIGVAAEGNTLNALAGSWTGTSPISTAYQWQRCNGPSCVNITGGVDADYKIGAIDRGYSLRVVQMAGNLISSVSQAASAPTAVLDPHPPTAPAPGNVFGVAGTPVPPGNVAATPTVSRLLLTRPTVLPRRFKAAQIRRGKLVRGTTISWRLNASAKVTIAAQKKAGKRWITVGSVQRDAKAGTTKYRFSGRLAGKLLKPGPYRFAVSAKRTAELKTGIETVTFTFLGG